MVVVGVYVLCEKLLVIIVEDVIVMCEVCECVGVIFMVVYFVWFLFVVCDVIVELCSG